MGFPERPLLWLVYDLAYFIKVLKLMSMTYFRPKHIVFEVEIGQICTSVVIMLC